LKILFAVDGSEYSVKAANYIATHFKGFQGGLELHLLHVHLPIPKGLAMVQAQKFLGEDTVDRYYKEESEAALAPAETILRKQNIPFVSTYKVGVIEDEICGYASSGKMDMIVMGSHGHGALEGLVMGSIATKVVATARDIPVLIVR
jgi:nucleotide-binding universal stress UspA family protein